MKSVLFLLSGNAQRIANANKLDINYLEIIKLDEKELSKPFKIISLLRNYKRLNIYFGTIDIQYQRFQSFIKIYLLLSLSLRGAILDEKGNQNKFNILKLFFLEIPLLIVELIYSIFLVIYYHIKVYWLKWKYTRN